MNKPPGSASADSYVVALRSPKVAKLRSEAKWGTGFMAIGYCILPSLFFRTQNRLCLRTSYLFLIVRLSEFRWYDNKLPWPKKRLLAERLGIKEKQV